MKLIRGLHNLKPFADGCVATIGNFDGVHKGHQVIVKQLQKSASVLALPTVVMVFEPQPREYFDAGNAPPRLMRFSEKLEALRRLQIDTVVCLQFNHRVRSLAAQAFIEEVLVQGLRARHLVVGDDFRFGCDRAGNFKLLEQYGKREGFSVSHTPTIEIEGDRVSSTRIRSLLMAGQFERAESLLGHAYSVTGRVVHGNKLGRQLGIPTANINLGRKKPVLKGVFAVEASFGDNRDLPAVANIGLRPSVELNADIPLLEVHLLGFDADIYGERLTIRFLRKIRDERKFDSLDALKQQIYADVASVEDMFR